MSIYLDHAATSFPKAPGVAEAMTDFLANDAGNPGRGGHRLTIAASRAVENARTEIAALLGAEPDRTLLGPGTTFWVNTILSGLLAPGDRVVTSALEHNAVMRPLRALEAARGIEVEVVRAADADGVPTAEEMRAAVEVAATRLVVITHASNINGAILPAAEIARAISPVPLLVDGAQIAGSVPLDVASLGAAAWVCSGHKALLGPPGVGVLVLAPGFDPPELIQGGTGSRSESETMPEILPDRLEAGTPNSVGIVGLGASCRWLNDFGIERVHEHTHQLAAGLIDGLETVPGLNFVGRRCDHDRVAVVSFVCNGVDSGELAAALDRDHGVMARTGLHCAPAAHQRLGSFPDGAVRLGVGPFTTGDEIRGAVGAIHETTLRLRSGGSQR